MRMPCHFRPSLRSSGIGSLLPALLVVTALPCVAQSDQRAATGGRQADQHASTCVAHAARRAAPATYTLRRLYRAGEVDRYQVTIALDAQEAKFTLRALLEERVRKLLPGGAAEVQSAVHQAHLNMQGQEIEMTPPDRPDKKAETLGAVQTRDVRGRVSNSLVNATVCMHSVRAWRRRAIPQMALQFDSLLIRRALFICTAWCWTLKRR